MEKVILSLYRLFGRLFSLTLPILSVFNSRTATWHQERKDIFLKIDQWKKQDTRPTILFHCASLGEFEQGHALIKRMKQKYPQYAVIVSFFSPSGYKNILSTIPDFITYLPLDEHKSIRMFLSKLQVKIALIIKNEFWPNLILELDNLDIPTFYISTHLSSHSTYPKLLFNQLFKKIDHFFVQNKASATFLEDRGVNKITISGDLRLLKSIENVHTPFDYPKLEGATLPIIVYGSIWKEDWNIIKYFCTHNPQYVHVLVPHSTDQATIDFFQREINDYKNTILIKEMGILKFLYRYATLAYVGGAFGEGLHNILEPAAYYIPIIFGPQYKKFPEAEELIKLGSAITINDYNGFKEGTKYVFEKQMEIKDCLERYFADKKPDLAIILEKIEKTLHE